MGGELVMEIFLRPAETSDCALIWRWRNDESTRRWFGNPDPIPYEDHKSWFFSKLDSPDTKIFIILNKETDPIGQVRFHLLSTKDAEIRIIIDPAYRNKGYGSCAIKKACKFAFEELGMQTIVAYIKSENELSLKAFSKAGFIKNAIKDCGAFKAIEMIFKKE